MSLKQQAFKAGRWTAISALLISASQLVQTVVLARLLSPADFGLMAVATSLLAVLGLFADLGIGRAVVHYDDIPREVLASLYWINLGVAALLMFGVVASAGLVGALFQSRELVGVLQTVSLLFPLTAFGHQFRMLAEKQLRFNILAGNEIAAAACGFVVSIGVALNGGGIYALVAGVLVVAAMSSILAWGRLSQGYRPSWRFELNASLRYLRFGGYSVGETVASTLHRQADIFVGGLIAGPAAMGIFSVPRDLSLRVATVVNPILTRVSFPVMARVKYDREKLKSIYLQVLRMTASVNFPIYVALMIFSDDVVAVLYGPRWAEAGFYLSVLGAWGLIRSIGSPVGSLLYAAGKTRLAFWWNMILLAIVPPVYLLGASLGGLIGLVTSVLAVQAAIFLPVWWFLVRAICGASILEYFEHFVAPLLIAISAGVCAYGATVGVDLGPTRLVLGIMVGAFVYGALSLRFNRPWVTAMRDLLVFTRRDTSQNTSA